MTERVLLFVVMGTTGEYSDRSEWPVAVVETKPQAEEFVAALTKQYQSLPGANQYHEHEARTAAMTLDPNFSEDYTGTTYFIYDVPFLPGRFLREKLELASVEVKW